VTQEFDYHTTAFTRSLTLNERQELLLWCLETLGGLAGNWSFEVKDLPGACMADFRSKDLMVFEFAQAKYKTLFEPRWASEIHLFEDQRHAQAYHQQSHRQYLRDMNKQHRGRPRPKTNP